MRTTTERWTYATLFFMAMAFLESAVVVYLRALYYPDGFHFPLRPMTGVVVTTEIWREVATMIMLWTVGAVMVRTALERFAWFCYGFGVWDLFYYIWLKVLLDWPATWSEPDLLFLLPVPWVGPVWAPCVVSLGLIALAIIILKKRGLDAHWRPGLRTWVLLFAAVGLFLTSFMLEPISQGLGTSGFIGADGPHQASMSTVIDNYVPGPFPWGWFVAGVVTSAAGLWSAWVLDQR